jgi:hypothetical protein
MDDKKYDSRYDGETTDKILDNAKAIMEQTTAEDGETVQVYDTNGVPHKVSKTELLKKSTLALPALEDISSFVAVNAAGNAVGVMTKEQVASVLAELNGGFIRRIQVSESFDSCINQGVYTINKSTFPSAINYPPGIVYGLLIVFSSANGWISQFAHNLENNTIHTRIRNENGIWNEWKQL